MTNGKSARKAPDVNKTRLAALKKLGLFADVDSRRTLTDAQKKRIREATRKNHELLTSPDQYVRQDLKDHYTATQKKILQNNGVRIVNNIAYIPKEGYKSARIKKDYIVIDGKSRMIAGIERTYGDRKTSFTPLLTNMQSADWVERINNEYAGLELKRGEFFAVKAWDHRPIARTFSTIEDFWHYESNQMHLAPGTNRALLRDNLHLVKITIREMRDIEADTMSRKELNAVKNRRKKVSKKIGMKRSKKH